jgi:hypothetical protein
MWIYRFLEGLYPDDFQAQFGRDMVITFRDAIMDARASDGTFGSVRLGIVMLAGLLGNSIMEQASRLKCTLAQEGSMRDFTRRIAQTTTCAAMVIAAGIAFVIWWQILLSGSFHSGIEQGIWFVILFDGAIAVVGILCLLFWKGFAKLVFE